MISDNRSSIPVAILYNNFEIKLFKFKRKRQQEHAEIFGTYHKILCCNKFFLY